MLGTSDTSRDQGNHERADERKRSGYGDKAERDERGTRIEPDRSFERINDNYVRDKIELPQDVRGFLLESLAEIEWRLSGATSDSLQRGDLIGTFVMVRELLLLRK